MSIREERAKRQVTAVWLNLNQLEAVLAAITMSGVTRDPDLNAATRKLGRARDRRERAVKRARRSSW
jgi:hypothetical protein